MVVVVSGSKKVVHFKEVNAVIKPGVTKGVSPSNFTLHLLTTQHHRQCDNCHLLKKTEGKLQYRSDPDEYESY